jgi:hypothetical protein
MTSPTVKKIINQKKTIGAIEDVTYNGIGIHIKLGKGADAISIINDITIGVFDGKKKVTAEIIKTLLQRTKQSVSITIDLAKSHKIIFLPIIMEVSEGAIAWLSYFEGKSERSIRFKLEKIS